MNIIGGIVFIIIGALFIGFAIYSIHSVYKLQKKGIKCWGKIVAYRSDEEGYQQPIIEFKTRKNEIIRETSSAHVSTDIDKITSYSHNIGMTVPILYDPDEPRSFLVAGDAESSIFVMALFTMMGIGAIVGGICVLFGYTIL